MGVSDLLRWCYRLNCWNPIPNVMVLGSWVFKKWLAHQGGALMSGISAFIKEPLETSLASWAMWGYGEKMAVYEEVGPHQTPNLPEPCSRTSQPPELGGINFCCFLATSLWYFAIAAWTDWDRWWQPCPSTLVYTRNMILIPHVPQPEIFWEASSFTTCPWFSFPAKFPSTVPTHTGPVPCSLSIRHVSQPTHLCSHGSFCLEVLPNPFYHFCVVCKFLKRITYKWPLSWRILCIHCPLTCNSVLSFLRHLPSVTFLVVKGPSAVSGT